MLLLRLLQIIKLLCKGEERGKRKEERGKRKEERGKRKEERRKRKEERGKKKEERGKKGKGLFLGAAFFCGVNCSFFTRKLVFLTQEGSHVWFCFVV
jgi:hypothetical protein